MSAAARVMVPVRFTPAMVVTGTTIAEPDTARGEVAWVSGASYTADTSEVTYAGSVYACVKTHDSHTVPPPDDLPGYWLRKGPTNRMAPFDDYISTQAVATGSLTFVLQPGFMNGISLYGMEGDTYSIVVKDVPGGTVIASKSGDLYAQAAGLWELLFTVLPTTAYASIDNVPVAANPEVTITVSSYVPTNRVAIGSIKIGDWRPFIGTGVWGAVSVGAEVERVSYTHREYNDDGSYTETLRGSSRDVRCTITLDANEALYVDAILSEIQDVAVPFEASDLPRYAYLNTMGFVTGTMRADTVATTSLNLKIKGNI